MFETVLDWIYPPRCMICHNIIPLKDERWLCKRCTDALTKVPKPVCAQCGQPLNRRNAAKQDGLCLRCSIGDGFYDRNVSAFLYDELAQHVIYRLKYGDHPEYAKGMAQLMFNVFKMELFENIDWITPIPMHVKKEWKRGYNQAFLMAKHLSKMTQTPVKPALRRIRNTKPQSGLNPRARQNNIQGAFSIENRICVAHKRILLVDDIFTTGSTISECAAVLKQQGAAYVASVTFAIVGDNEESP